MCVQFIMAKRHPVRNSAFMKAFRCAFFLPRRQLGNKKNNSQPVLLPHAVIMG
jgi:hypothetical protein